MIRYESPPTGATPDELALRHHVAAELVSACGSGASDSAYIGELATAVAALCRNRLGLRAVPDELLSLLGAKALWAAGEQAAAHRMLNRYGRAAEDRLAVASLYPAAGGPSLELCLLIAGGLVRPSRCAFFADGPVWSLNAGRALGEAGAPLLELTMRRQVCVVLGHLAEVWNGSGGRGALEVRGWSRMGEWVRPALRREVLHDCRAFLARTGAQRGWPRIPEVFDGFSRACH